MKLKFALGLTLAAIAVLAMACGGDKKPAPAQPAAATKQATTPAPAAPAPAAPAAAPAPAPAAGATVITVDQNENPYRFGPAKFELQVGKDYTFDVRPGKEFHTFTIKDLKVDVQMNAGQGQKVPVKPAKAGTFKLVCVVHESLGMVGEIVVK